MLALLTSGEPFNYWQSVTGSLEQGESPLDAAMRELHEETGIVAGDALIATGVCREFEIDPRWRDRFAPGVTVNREHEFHFRLQTPISVQLCDDEHDDYAWVSPDVAIERCWSWTNRAALEFCREQRR